MRFIKEGPRVFLNSIHRKEGWVSGVLGDKFRECFSLDRLSSHNRREKLVHEEA